MLNKKEVTTGLCFSSAPIDRKRKRKSKSKKGEKKRESKAKKVRKSKNEDMVDKDNEDEEENNDNEEEEEEEDDEDEEDGGDEEAIEIWDIDKENNQLDKEIVLKNWLLATARVTVECFFGRIKQWQLCGQRVRNRALRYYEAFVFCVLVMCKFIRKPIRT